MAGGEPIEVERLRPVQLRRYGSRAVSDPGPVPIPVLVLVLVPIAIAVAIANPIGETERHRPPEESVDSLDCGGARRDGIATTIGLARPPAHHWLQPIGDCNCIEWIGRPVERLEYSLGAIDPVAKGSTDRGRIEIVVLANERAVGFGLGFGVRDSDHVECAKERQPRRGRGPIANWCPIDESSTAVEIPVPVSASSRQRGCIRLVRIDWGVVIGHSGSARSRRQGDRVSDGLDRRDSRCRCRHVDRRLRDRFELHGYSWKESASNASSVSP